LDHGRHTTSALTRDPIHDFAHTRDPIHDLHAVPVADRDPSRDGNSNNDRASVPVRDLNPDTVSDIVPAHTHVHR
jgi:hypothetical protein